MLCLDEAGNKLFSMESVKHDYNLIEGNEDALYHFLHDLHTWVS